MPAAPGQSAPGLRIGRLRGVPIYIGRSWILVGLVIAITFQPTVTDYLPEVGNAASYLVALAFAVLLLVSVLVHEAAHALTAQARGYRVSRIVADLWGGHTAYDNEESTPGASALIAVVGPLSNAVLAAGAYAAAMPLDRGVARLLLEALFFANAFVAVFNMLPGLPLDGGYLVDALVWRVTGSRAKGLIAAGWSGRAVTILMVVLLVVIPASQGAAPNMVTAIWVGLIGLFMWVGATAAIARGRSQNVVGSVGLRALLRPLATARADTSAADLPAVDTLVFDGDGRGLGLVPAGSVMSVPIDRRNHTPASALVQVQPPGWICTVPSPDADVMALVQAAQTGGNQVSRFAVLDPRGAPLGIVLRDDLYHALHAAFARP